MRSGKFMGSLLASAAIGAMTPAERARGRYMRAPDGHGSGSAEFDEFVASGDVETGDGVADIEVSTDGTKPAAEEKPKRRNPPKPAATPTPTPTPSPAGEDEDPDAEDPDAEDPEGEEGEDEDEPKPEPKPKKKASERIRELNARLRQEQRERERLTGRLEALEKGLPATQGGDNSAPDIGEAPDPSDTDKYPLGHLDDAYIEDKLEWLATKKAAERADAVLQRQQQNEQRQAQERDNQALLAKVDDLSTRGSELFEDFQETVVDAGMRGDWRLDRPTFEAAAEAEHGVQILYDLAQDKAEAKRVAELSPYQQLKYVLDKNAEIAAKAKPRTKPQAGAPPQTQTRGANSRTRINPATDNLDDFEKAWVADAKGK